MSNYVLNDEKMFADITDGIAIVINSETGIYYGMNEFATIVFEQLIKGVTSSAIFAEIKTMVNVPSDLEERFNNFINLLLEKELIKELPLIEAGVGVTSQSFNSHNSSAFHDFALILKEYNDAQELLLADPIHEVKEDTGWTPEKDSIGYTKEETALREMKAEV